mmetsp:Transcript_24341/g.40006  ORF Transcript_24341/g.40006 Transcript_24341/m.40006 type:complete len:205 (-) Transcript_24341:164-778(-)
MYAQYPAQEKDALRGPFSVSLSRALLRAFTHRICDRVECVYMKHRNMSSSTPVLQTLLPLSMDSKQLEEDAHLEQVMEEGNSFTSRQKKRTKVDLSLDNDKTGSSLQYHHTNSIILEPSKNSIDLLETLAYMYLEAQVVRAVFEGYASEQSSRLSAMTEASKNASELLRTLQLLLNRERQRNITQDLIECISNAEAFKQNNNSD